MVYHQWFINTYQYEVYHHHVNGISMVYQWYLNRASWCIINVRVYHPNGESMAKKKVTPLESSHHHNRPVRGAHHIILLFRSTSSVEISINSHESFDRCKWKYIYCHGSYRWNFPLTVEVEASINCSFHDHMRWKLPWASILPPTSTRISNFQLLPQGFHKDPPTSIRSTSMKVHTNLHESFHQLPWK